MSGMHIAFDLSFTHTEGAWARPGSWVGLDFPDVRMFMELARTAERAGVGMLFFGDGSGVPSTWRGSITPAVEWGIQWPRHDMAPVIAAMAGQTFTAPSGIVSKMDERNHHLHKAVFIGEVKGDGQFNVVWKTKTTIRAQPWSPFVPGNEKKQNL